MGHRTRQIRLICEWVLGLAWLANLQKSCLSKHSAKTAKQGRAWERGVFPYPSGENRTQAGQRGNLALRTVDLLDIF